MLHRHGIHSGRILFERGSENIIFSEMEWTITGESVNYAWWKLVNCFFWSNYWHELLSDPPSGETTVSSVFLGGG